ncbi:hypothetical protein LCGC14_0576990 [marine sediment metagenome]|uniref:Uncharacterized protein n=1 Tax=marine sediment metagenome TaxID=412755 RepID=A0A0F9S126_9ZZZZ|nr:hypothetical protein [bacterium]
MVIFQTGNKKLFNYGFTGWHLDLSENGVHNMKIKAGKSVVLPDGKHEGKITGVVYRDDPYEYTDIEIEENKKQLKIKYGCPSDIKVDDEGNAKTKLARLLGLFTEVKQDGEYDPEEILVGKKVSFQTLTKKTDKGEFSNVVSDSVKSME